MKLCVNHGEWRESKGSQNFELLKQNFLLKNLFSYNNLFLLEVNAKCNTNGILVDCRSLTHIVKDELKFEDFETNNHFIELVDENRESNIALKRGNAFKGHEWQNVQLNFV